MFLQLRREDDRTRKVFVLRQAVALVDEQLVGFGENVLGPYDRAQIVD